jgi:hypothetical protein
MEEVRNRISALLSAGRATPESVATALRLDADVLAADLRPGLVKTEPPLVELVVQRRDDAGTVSAWVYDLTVLPDGRVRLEDDHEA